jgi:hypothetical protein
MVGEYKLLRMMFDSGCFSVGRPVWGVPVRGVRPQEMYLHPLTELSGQLAQLEVLLAPSSFWSGQHSPWPGCEGLCRTRAGAGWPCR